MEKSFLSFKDKVSFEINEDSFDQIQDAVSKTAKTGKTLQVEMAATHAGIIVLNNRLYPPSYVKEGSKSFVDGYAKPILKHHDKTSDPIGRVVASEYIDTSSDLLKKYNTTLFTDAAKHTNHKFNKFINGQLSYEDQVDFILDNINQRVLRDKSYKGFGYVKLTANIPDPDAQQKFLDQRYFTFSTGASTSHASCSICRQDLAIDGLCEHELGGVYDNQMCYLITGPLSYNECSVVNKPADIHSEVIGLHMNDKVVNIPMSDILENKQEPVILKLSNIEMLDKENSMKKKNKATVPDNLEDNKDTENVDDNTSDQNPEDVKVDDKDSGTDDKDQDQTDSVEEFDDFITRVLNDGASGEDVDKIYDMMCDEMAEDAKLSTAARKKLPKSKFCGPDRSFPVPDCAHITAARRLIGRYKGPGDKSKILACVNRKAKALGCDAKDSEDKKELDTNDSAGYVMQSIISVLSERKYEKTLSLSDDEVKALQEILKRLSGLVGTDAFASAAKEEKLGLDQEAEDAFCDHVASLESQIGEFNDHLVALREEYQLLNSDMSNLQDKYSELQTSDRKIKERLYTLTKILHDGEIPSSEDLIKMETVSIADETDKLTEKLDVNTIVDKLNNGMARNPQGKVDDPTEVVDNCDNMEDSKKDEMLDTDHIMEKLLKSVFQGGPRGAELYLSKIDLSKIRKVETE